jgi:hypothetical protein
LSTSWLPEEKRWTDAIVTSDSGLTSKGCTEIDDEAVADSCERVFHCPQLVHRPDHFGNWASQLEQAKIVFAMGIFALIN